MLFDSPLVQELFAERYQQTIQKFLGKRFGVVPQEIVDAVRAVEKVDRLEELIRLAVECPDLEAFRRGLPKKRRRRESPSP